MESKVGILAIISPAAVAISTIDSSPGSFEAAAFVISAGIVSITADRLF
jgi:hypothetical protein